MARCPVDERPEAGEMPAVETPAVPRDSPTPWSEIGYSRRILS